MTIEWETKVRTFSKGQIGSCKKCKTIVRRTVQVTVKETYRSDKIGAVSKSVSYEGYTPVYCKCPDRQIAMDWIEGVCNPEVRCDERCTSAKGHKCECSCGGKNHGAAHG